MVYFCRLVISRLTTQAQEYSSPVYKGLGLERKVLARSVKTKTKTKTKFNDKVAENIQSCACT